MFKRKNRKGDSEGTPEQVEVVESAGDTDEAPVAEQFDESAFKGVAAQTAPGPYDITDVPDGAMKRVDLGCMQIAGFTDMQLHFETDPSKSRLVSVVAAYQDAALRLQALAAPRSGGLWEDMRPQIMSSIAAAGGDVEEVQGAFGTELRGIVPAALPDGTQVRQPIRLIGYEGPRWLLHGVFMGSAPENDAMAELFEDVFRQVVVVRGVAPMAPGEVLPIVLPPDAQPVPATGQTDGQPPAGGEPPAGGGQGLLA